MQDQLVFQEKKEMERLGVQNALLEGCEAPLFAHLFSARHGLTVLDVGCNDGTKTAARLQSDAVARVIGLEYNAALAERAQARYGDAKLSFHAFDAEAPALPARLRRLMEREGIDGFDVIYLSFVLINLRDPAALLAALRHFLKPDGQLVIVEPNDGASSLSGDGAGLLEEFLALLAHDPYAGDRTLASRLDRMLADCGYDKARVWCEGVTARGGETEKKRDIFTTFFSYLPEDTALLRAASPENTEYLAWEAWLAAHYDALRHLILRPDTEITMGLRVLTCTAADAPRRFTAEDGRAFTLTPLTRGEVALAKRLSDKCVGENLYSEAELTAALTAPDRVFRLLKTDAGDTAGYLYYYLTTLDALAAYAKLPAETLRAVLPAPCATVGKLQSVGVDEGYRGLALAAQMLTLALDDLRARGVRAAFIVCWKHGGTVPLGSAVRKCGFRYLTEAHNVWYDDASLVCPYCEGRCKCDAEVYYKLLDEEENA